MWNRKGALGAPLSKIDQSRLKLQADIIYETWRVNIVSHEIMYAF